MREIRDAFDGQLRAVPTLYDSDICGVPMLLTAGDALFA
jgi:hypothetical protein